MKLKLCEWRQELPYFFTSVHILLLALVFKKRKNYENVANIKKKLNHNYCFICIKKYSVIEIYSFTHTHTPTRAHIHIYIIKTKNFPAYLNTVTIDDIYLFFFLSSRDFSYI